MVTLFDPFTRKQGTTLAHFSNHWTAIHAEIAKTIPQIKHYVQNHRRDQPVPEALSALGTSRVDGSSQTWYESVDELRAILDEPGTHGLMVDEENFMDLVDFPRYPVMTEQISADGEETAPTPERVKLLVFTRRRTDVDADAFRDTFVGDDDQALGRAVGAIRHVRCPRLGDMPFPNPEVKPGGDVGFDGVRELWWPDVAAFEAGTASDREAWARLITPEGIDAARSFPLFAYERLIID